MNILLWALFGLINGLLLNTFDKSPKKESMTGSMLLGMFGAISGGAVAYLLFGGVQSGFDMTLVLVMFFEAVLIYMLTSKKSLHRI
jgi:uncharacterized membrane protein YeaQ/YmgE (transglycosylase-associated protein family)